MVREEEGGGKKCEEKYQKEAITPSSAQYQVRQASWAVAYIPPQQQQKKRQPAASTAAAAAVSRRGEWRATELATAFF